MSITKKPKNKPKPQNQTKTKNNYLVYADNIICFLVSNVIFELIPSHLLSSSLVVLELLSFLSIGSHLVGLILLILYFSMQEKSMLKRYGVVKPFNSLYTEHRKLRKNQNRYTPLSCNSALRETEETKEKTGLSSFWTAEYWIIWSDKYLIYNHLIKKRELLRVQMDLLMSWKPLLGCLTSTPIFGLTVQMRMWTSQMKHFLKNSIDGPNYSKQVSGLVQMQCLLCITGSLSSFNRCSSCCVCRKGKVEIKGVPPAPGMWKTPLRG